MATGFSLARGQGGTAVPFESFTPGACALAPHLIDQLASRDIADLTVYMSAKDTTSRLSADSVRVCSSAFGGSTNDEWELLNFARVQLVLAADADARAAAQRYLTAVGTSAPAKRAWALYLATSDLLAARPARFVAARERLVELDKLGAPAGKARVLGHFALANAAKRHHDETTVASEANTVISVWKTLPQALSLQLAVPLASSYIMKAEIALRGAGVTAAQAIIDTADRVVPANAGSARQMINVQKRLYTILGKSAAPIDAQFWFGGTFSGAPKPSRGRVTLISGTTHACGPSCRARYNGLRRFGVRFGDRIDIVNMTKTLGFHSDTAPIAPQDEAKYDSAYFLGKHRLPGALAVYETKFEWIPDGRRRNNRTPQETNYPYASLVVVNKKGVVRYANTGWDSLLEEPLAQFIERLIAEP